MHDLRVGGGPDGSSQIEGGCMYDVNHGGDGSARGRGGCMLDIRVGGGCDGSRERVHACGG